MLITAARAVAMTSLVLALQAGQATAQNVRSFVSGHGSDSNPCSLTAPCRSLQVAHNATNPKGEVVVLDSAGYGALNITKAISIVNPGGVEAGVTSQTGDAITIAAGPNDTVSLRGLTLEGAGSTHNGVTFSTGLRLEIIDCVIRDFVEGILISPNVFASVYVANTITSDNSDVGVKVLDSSKTGLIAVLDRYTSINNAVGVDIEGAAGGAIVEVLISNSHVSNNIFNGITIFTANLILRNTILNQNPTGIYLFGGNIWLSQVIEASVPGLPNSGGVVIQSGDGNVYSDGTSHIAGVTGGSFQPWP